MAVSGAALEEYPIERDVRLDSHSFTKWHHLRWLSSRSFKLSTWEVQGMARALFDLSQLESPVGTLPDNDEELAYMLRVDTRRISELRRMEYGPLRNWRPCLSEGERRLMHPVVLAQVQDALDRRELHRLSKDAQATVKRLQRLREALRKIGVKDAALNDEALIQRIDAHLSEHCRGFRTVAAITAALQVAMQQRWLDRSDLSG